MANSADPDQLPTDLDLHSLQRQGISGFSRTRVKYSVISYAETMVRKEVNENFLTCLSIDRQAHKDMKESLTFSNPSLAKDVMPCLSKQCGSRSVGF